MPVGRPRKEFVQHVLQLLRAELREHGWKKRAGEVFTRAGSPDVIGWLSLNLATQRQDGVFEVNASVGVRHQLLEEVCARLGEQAAIGGMSVHEYSPVTLADHVGYLGAAATYVPALFEEDADPGPEVTRLIESIQGDGLRFIARHPTLGAIIASLQGRYPHGHPSWANFSLPVALFLLDRPAEARAALELYVGQMAIHLNAAGDDYRRYAALLADPANLDRIVQAVEASRTRSSTRRGRRP